MSTKIAAPLILLAIAISAAPEISVEITKSKFLFIKWINFTPSYTGKIGAEQVALAPLSNFYIFADYVGKVQRKEMSVSINYKVNGKDGIIAPLTVNVLDEKINTEAFKVKECFADDKFVAVFQNVVRTENDFALHFDINCLEVNLPNTIRELGELGAELVDNLQNEKDKPVPSKLAESKINPEKIPEEAQEEQLVEGQDNVHLEGSKHVIL